MNTTENYAKQIKNAKRHIDKRDRVCETKHLRAKLKKMKRELETLECANDEFPLYQAGFNEAIGEALKKIGEILK